MYQSEVFNPTVGPGRRPAVAPGKRRGIARAIARGRLSLRQVRALFGVTRLIGGAP